MPQFPARISDGDGSRYSWREVEDRGGKMVDKLGGKQGSIKIRPAFESNRNPRVPYGTVVMMHEQGDGDFFTFWWDGE